MTVQLEMKVFGFLRRFFAGLGYKLLALLIAILIWAGLLTGRTTYRDVEATVDVGGLVGGMVISGDVPEIVPVRIRGRGIEVIRVNEDDFVVNLRLESYGPGKYNHKISNSDIIYRGPREIEIDRVLGADEFEVEIQKRVAKSVPIRVHFEGRPKPGYYLGLPSVSPPKTTFFGPEPVINGLDYVTVTVNVSGAKTSVLAPAVVEPPLPGITLIGAKEVDVFVNIEGGKTKVFRNVPTEVRRDGNVVAGRTEPAKVTVAVEGALERLNAMDEPVVYIELEKAVEGRYPVEVMTDEYVSLVEVDPAYVGFVGGE